MVGVRVPVADDMGGELKVRIVATVVVGGLVMAWPECGVDPAIAMA